MTDKTKWDAWKVPEADRPPVEFWKDFGNFMMATYAYDDSDEYVETLMHWADVLQKRYGGQAMTGKVIMDYLDGLMLKMRTREIAEIA